MSTVLVALPGLQVSQHCGPVERAGDLTVRLVLHESGGGPDQELDLVFKVAQLGRQVLVLEIQR